MRQTLRSLSRRKAFTVAALLTVALGVGANTAVFRVIYGVLIKPLPFRDPGRLVQLWETHPAFRQLQATVPDFRDWQMQSHGFEQMAAHTLAAMDRLTLLGEGAPEAVQGTNATSDLFATMGIRPLLGRAYTAAEDRGRARAVLIGEKLWRRKFGADPNIIGRQIRLEPLSFTVIGVVPEAQTFPHWADVWMPFSLLEDQLVTRRKYHPLEVIARLKPGVSVAQAQAEMQSIAQRLAREYPDTNGSEGAVVVPLETEITGDARPSLILVWAAVGLVLLIACANLAHLLLARMLERRDELAIRSALGASSRHLVGYVLTESLVLAGMGGAAGAGVAVWAGGLLGKLAQGQIPRLESAGFPAPVWLFAAAVSVVCGLLFGLPACWRVLGIRRAAGRSVIRARSRFGAALMAGEVALAFVVLAGAALLMHSFVRLLDENPGFEERGVMAIDITFPSSVTNPPSLVRTQLLPALRALPGVQQAANANAAPMSLLPTEHSRWATRFGIAGRVFPSGQYPVAQIRYSTPEYFGVLGIPLQRGQWLGASDEGKPKCLINATLARTFFPNQDPVGRRLVLGVMDPRQGAIEIAGVVGDVREFGMDEEPVPSLYLIGAGPGTILLKTSGKAAPADRQIRQAVDAINSDIVVGPARGLEQNVADSLARRRFALTLLGVFAGLAAVLTAAGIYGLLAYSVNARLREFGVRAAVGATQGRLVRMVLREAAAVALPGLAAGMALSFAFAKLFGSLAYGVPPFDPWSNASAGLFLLLVAALSAGLPARKAAGVDAAAALRAE